MGREKGRRVQGKTAAFCPSLPPAHTHTHTHTHTRTPTRTHTHTDTHMYTHTHTHMPGTLSDGCDYICLYIFCICWNLDLKKLSHNLVRPFDVRSINHCTQQIYSSKYRLMTKMAQGVRWWTFGGWRVGARVHQHGGTHLFECVDGDVPFTSRFIHL